MTEQQIEIVWSFFSYRTHAATGIETIKDIVCSGCKSFVFEPCSDFMKTPSAPAMYTVAVCYKIPRYIFPRTIYMTTKVGPLAEAFSVTSEEIMELVALYEL